MMRRILLPASVVVAAIALLVLLGFGVAQQGDSTSLDAAVTRGRLPQAPSATHRLPVLGTTRTMTLADFRGRLVVLNVFASWCGPCKDEAPLLDRAQSRLAAGAGRGTAATVVGVTYLDNSHDSEQFVRAEHINYPVLRDVDGSFVRSFGDTTGVPETFVIDSRGRVVAIRRYQLDQAWLDRAIARGLRDRA